MRYETGITDNEIQDNHETCYAKLKLYKDMGLDFFEVRKSILDKTGLLEGRILDVGTGKGVMAVFLAREGYSFTSIDNNEDMLRMAALNLAYEGLLDRAELHVMDLNSMEFADGSFDNIFMIEALHHVHDADKALSEMDRVLSPAGTMVLADFNKKGFGTVDKVHRKEGHTHMNSLSGIEDARKWLSGRGYAVEEAGAPCHWVLIAKKER